MFLDEKMSEAVRIQHEKSEERARRQAWSASDEERHQLGFAMEKGDLPAMIIAAFLVIFPPVMVALLLMGLAAQLFLR